MIKSMTGFASLTHEDERATLGVTLRSVNHRFLDLQLRVPQSLAERPEPKKTDGPTTDAGVPLEPHWVALIDGATD